MNPDRLRNLRASRPILLVAEPGQLPPQDPEVEQKVLGQIMLEKDALAKVSDLLVPETFYVDAHSRIYAAIQALGERDEPADIVTVTAELRKRGDLDVVGGPFYVSQLTNGIGSSANIQYHAMILVQKHMLRENIRYADETKRMAYAEDADCFEVMDHIEAGLATCHNYLSHRELHTAEKAADQAVNGKAPAFIRFNTPGLGSLMCQHGLVHVCAGRTGMGKSIFSTFEAWEWAKFGRVLMFSPEMTERQVVSRILSMESGVPYTRIIAREMDANEEALVAAAHVRPGVAERWKNLIIDPTEGINPKQVGSKITRALADGPLYAIVIDHLHEMQSGIPHIDTDSSSRPRVSYCISRVSSLCKKLNLPFLVMAQLSRETEKRPDKIPKISDIYWSSDVDQKAAMIILLYRAGYYLPEPPYEDELQLIVAKNRDGAVNVKNCRIIPALNRLQPSSSAPITLKAEPAPPPYAEDRGPEDDAKDPF